MKKIFCFVFFFSLVSFSCSNLNENPVVTDKDIIENDTIKDNPSTKTNVKILTLGDSYTIGSSVCSTCRFPNQLQDSLTNHFDTKTTVDLKIIAKLGWTTTNLKNAIALENLNNDFDLVTLLIGVNNQYQGKSFSTYETEFPELVSIAVKAAKNKTKDVIVISIPDYAFTPFGNGNPEISKQIDNYNLFAEDYCRTRGITFVNITEITRNGLINPNLVASDGLHPSELAYTKFVELILPLAVQKLKD